MGRFPTANADDSPDFAVGQSAAQSRGPPRQLASAYNALLRYAVYDPEDARKGSLLKDPVLGQIILGEGETITKALAACQAPSGAVVWDRRERRVAYTVPTAE